MSIRSAIVIASITGLVCLAMVCTGLALQLLYCWMELDEQAIQKTACKSNRTFYSRNDIPYSFTPYFSIYILYLFFSFLRFQWKCRFLYHLNWHICNLSVIHCPWHTFIFNKLDHSGTHET